MWPFQTLKRIWKHPDVKRACWYPRYLEDRIFSNCVCLGPEQWAWACCMATKGTKRNLEWCLIFLFKGDNIIINILYWFLVQLLHFLYSDVLVLTKHKQQIEWPFILEWLTSLFPFFLLWDHSGMDSPPNKDLIQTIHIGLIQSTQCYSQLNVKLVCLLCCHGNIYFFPWISVQICSNEMIQHGLDRGSSHGDQWG